LEAENVVLRRWGSKQCSPSPLAGFKEAISGRKKEREKERKEEGKQSKERDERDGRKHPLPPKK